jgi:hypothetical protein
MQDYKFFLQENYFKQVFVSETSKEEPWEVFDFFTVDSLREDA